MKQRAGLFLLCTVMLGSLYACGVNGPEEKDNNPIFCPAIDYCVNYTLTVINNTDSPVKGYGMGWFSKNITANTADVWENDKAKSILYSLNPYEKKEYISNDSGIQWTHDTYGKDLLKPYTYSFYMKLVIDESEYYLAGWPASDNSFVHSAGIPAEKIALNGLGWVDNTQKRAKKNGDDYVPFIINHEGQTEDFDTVSCVYATAVLTINSNSKDGISFKTTSLAASNYEEKASNPSPRPFDNTVFEAEKAAWKAQNMERYRFVLRAESGARGREGPFAVLVPDAPPQADGPLVFASIDNVYEFITNVYSEHGGGAYLEIRYDTVYHYPDVFSFGLGPVIDGSGYRIIISDFEPLR